MNPLNHNSPEQQLNNEAVRIAMDNEQDFETAFRQYYPALCYFAGRIVGEDIAEDMVEDVFSKLWKKDYGFNSHAQLRSFLYSSVKNRCLDNIRAEKSSGALSTAYYNERPKQAEDYSWEITRTEVIRQLHIAIAKLPQQAGKIISLTYIDGMSNQEAADELGLSIQTIKNQKLRGLSQLRKIMPEDRYLLLLAIPILTSINP